MTVIVGDTLEVMARMPEASIDAVCTDPPYGLGFMGHEWDQPGEYAPVRGEHWKGGGPSFSAASEAGRYDLSRTANQRYQAWCEAWASEALRVLKPGGYLLAFGGTRTYHRLACAVEDAGFEIRDRILVESGEGGDAEWESHPTELAWMYGSGFP